MLWVYLMLSAIASVAIGRKLKKSDEVHSIAVNFAGLISVIWGFIVAPPSVQLLLGVLLLGFNQLFVLRS